MYDPKEVECVFLRAVIAWYADKPGATRLGPYSGSGSVREPGRIASRVASAKHNGELFVAVCDAWGYAVSDIARRLNIDEARMSSFSFSGRGLSEEEERHLVHFVQKEVLK